MENLGLVIIAIIIWVGILIWIDNSAKDEKMTWRNKRQKRFNQR